MKTETIFGGIALVMIVITVGILTGQSVVYGQIIKENSYIGVGQISSAGLGGSNGQTSTITFYNLTVSYEGQTLQVTVACNLYHIGSSFPLYRNTFYGLNTHVSAWPYLLPTGCPAS